MTVATARAVAPFLIAVVDVAVGTWRDEFAWIAAAGGVLGLPAWADVLPPGHVQDTRVDVSRRAV